MTKVKLPGLVGHVGLVGLVDLLTLIGWVGVEGREVLVGLNLDVGPVGSRGSSGFGGSCESDGSAEMGKRQRGPQSNLFSALQPGDAAMQG